MAEVVHVLCAVMSLACAILLVRAWAAVRTKLLLWSSVCFTGLFINSVLLVVDELVAVDGVSLVLLRDATNLVSVGALVVGLVWSTK